MCSRRLHFAVLLALLAFGWAAHGRLPEAHAAEALDVDTIRAGLRTAESRDIDYIRYVVALVDQNRLPRKMFDGAFLWARQKPFYLDHQKFQYFKHAMIAQAAQMGVRLPQGTPDVTPDVTGRVVMRVALVNVPAPNATVTLQGTGITAKTNLKGEFTLPSVPLGSYVLEASTNLLVIPKKGSTVIHLPAPPPSTGAAFVTIRIK